MEGVTGTMAWLGCVPGKRRGGLEPVKHLPFFRIVSLAEMEAALSPFFFLAGGSIGASGAPSSAIAGTPGAAGGGRYPCFGTGELQVGHRYLCFGTGEARTTGRHRYLCFGTGELQVGPP